MSELDEREGLPSISQFEALSLCPARFRLSRMVPKPPESEDALYGRQVARARETGDVEDLTDEQRELVSEMAEQEKILLKQIGGKTIPAEGYREKRFWYYQAKQKLFSGKLDFSAWFHGQERVALYFDDKSLWGDTTPAPQNLQLRAGAVLLKQHFGSSRVFVAILQPTLRKFAIAAEYGPGELSAAELECVAIVKRAMYPDSEPNPGPDQCRYCPAKLICPVAYKESVVAIAQTTRSDILMPSISDDALDRMGHAWEIAQIVGKEIDSEIKRRKQADPDSMPNYEWKSNGDKSEIGRADLVFDKFKDLLTPERFLNAIAVKKGELEDEVFRANKLDNQKATKKAAVAETEQRLGDLLIKTPKAKSLIRKPHYKLEDI